MAINWSKQKQACFNLTVDALLQRALGRGEGVLASNGALVVTTGNKTGRSPKDRFFVKSGETVDNIDWGPSNQPFDPEKFDPLLEKVLNHLGEKEVFIHEGYACANPEQRFTIRVAAEFAWHALFAHHLFLRLSPGEKLQGEPDMTILAVPRFLADPKVDGTRSGTFIVIHFEKRIILIGGTQYAGEIKKSIFTTLNYLLPKKGILPMHCSANVGAKEDTALFFGLSGTGKTTLSADPNRKLIGDDEHAWNHHGIFNLEGGCYAKCINLSQKDEPQIWGAIRRGTVVENVAFDRATKEIDYADASITENTRAGYPIDYIANAKIPGIGSHPKVIFFLTADAFGVLPPVSRLTPEEAMYHFISGYTAKLAGTEAGVKDPQATFSSCFGAPFLPRPATFYAKMFGERLKKHAVPVYLVNTGWIGGPVGVGKRISLPHTRAMIEACLNGSLAKAVFKPVPQFHLSIPSECSGVPADLLDPMNMWKNKESYKVQATKLSQLFEQNFRKFS